MAIRYDDFEDLIVEVQDGIGHFRINRPEVLNALRTQTFWEVVELGRRFQVDDDVRVVVCSHEGRGFSAGADLAQRNPVDPERTPNASPNDSMGISTIGLAMPGLDKPTIAAINGVCAGAGYAFALSFDIRYLGPQARFVTVFGRRALSPDCGMTYHLPRLVGPAKALELLYTSRDVFAEEALALGLGNELVEDPLDRAFEVAAQLVEGAPLSMMWMKREVRHAWGADLKSQIEFEWSAQGQLRGTADVAEGRASFLEQRPAKFTGR
ncbi:MAG: enoyl-CoA hydratase/isomerase family protein [Dehalococcoidia bacterium]|nr:enoyl-CoA hydratase/isomerase family protein [Dehalococcoidia bacterium]